MDAEQQFQAAAQRYQSGDFAGAEACLEPVAQALPGNPNVLHLLSLARLQQGKAEAAAESLKTLTEVAPNSADAHDLLGVALRQAGRINAALRHFRRALELNPQSADIHYNLGNAYRDDRQVERAATHFKKAVELDPNNANAYFNLGQAHMNRGDMMQALQAFQQATRLAPQDVEALSLLADAAFALQSFPLARKACEDVLAIAPDSEEVLYRHAQCAIQQGDYAVAAESLDKALALLPDDIELLHAKARVLRSMGDAEGALALYGRAVQVSPDSIDNRAELGRLLERMNKLDEAWEAISPGLDAAPDDPALNLVAARLERRAGDDRKALERLTRLDAAQVAVSPAQGEIGFELGTLYDRMGRPGDAVEQFEKGNAYLARDEALTNMYLSQSREYLDRLHKAYEALADAKPVSPPAAEDTATPVFLVGFPRSGTTLLDQVMDAHPGVQVLEEQSTLSAVRDRLLTKGDDFPANLFDISESELAGLREVYFQAVDQVIDRDPAARLVDKLPLNILDAGLIHRLFPSARFILALRHPCDVCLSCFMQPFELNPGMVHFTRLDDTVKFYEEVMTLWQIQREALNLDVHQVRYEDLVTELEPVARDLLEFLGVPWDDRVLDPAAHARAQSFIGTNSYHQVVQDVNTKAVDRWRKYEIHMTPHLPRLRPLIKAFGYDNA